MTTHTETLRSAAAEAFGQLADVRNAIQREAEQLEDVTQASTEAVTEVAELLRGRFETTVKVIVNPVEGVPWLLCSHEAESGPHARTYWWVGLGTTEKGISGTCGSGSDTPETSDDYEILTRFTTSVRSITEGPLALKLKTEPAGEIREFLVWPTHSDAFVPLVVPDQQQRETLGVRELILVLEARVAGWFRQNEAGAGR